MYFQKLLSNMNIQGYTPIPNTLTVHEHEWKEALDNFVLLHGVKWIHKRTVKDTPRVIEVPEVPEGSQPPKKKRLVAPKRYIWYVDYDCHRNGSKRDRVAEGYVEKGGVSGKSRDLQKASKKISCPAKLKVSCFKKDPSNVVFAHTGVHNHEVGGEEDMKYLPLSIQTRTRIEERLREGYANRDTRIAIQSNLRQFVFSNTNTGTEQSSSITHRDQMIDSDQLYNLHKKIQESFFKLHDDQHESVKLWLQNLGQKGYSSFLGADFQQNYTFGFVSPWQKQLLVSASSICLDAAHDITTIEKGILYTIVLRHPTTGTGCPVAHMYTTDDSMLPIAEFLLFLRDKIGLSSSTLKEISIDSSSTDYGAIKEIYPLANIQGCLFHVARFWMAKIKEMVKPGNATLNTAVHKSMIIQLKSMMWEKDTTNFVMKLAHFLTQFAMYPDFMSYMKNIYFDGAKPALWCAAFQPQVFNNMEAFNFVESWHNQLKSTYLERRRSRRIDRLVFILINDIDHDYIQNIDRIRSNIGRMDPEERVRRRREINAEEINEAIMRTMVEKITNDDMRQTYRVQSFTCEEIKYDIIVENEKMGSCNCEDFIWNRFACKHMYLLKRIYRDILVYKGNLFMWEK
ncbi:unnamed protein product [Mucor hiemalis]